MAILFDWYEDPKPSNKQQGENGNTLHPRIKYNGSTGTDVLRRRIQERCSLTETDVTAVLDALSHIMGQELAEGRQVHLDGIGYFHPCLTTTEPILSCLDPSYNPSQDASIPGYLKQVLDETSRTRLPISLRNGKKYSHATYPTSARRG